MISNSFNPIYVLSSTSIIKIKTYIYVASYTLVTS